MRRSLHKNKTKRNIPLRVASVLLCMTLLSAYFVAGLYARYATSSLNSNSARVAKFSITGDGLFQQQTITADLIPGAPYETALSIHNNSEVAVEYTVAVSNETGNLPLQLRMTKDGASAADEGNNSVTFTQQQLPGSHTDNYELQIEWPSENKDSALMGMVDYITVTVTAAQID